ncbi:complex I NDUFA9 subunit family protein [Pseudahrensia aquimaris]|uniref:Complex I NDUFA9 subunit family protein n=1 Tax=Pseudahrensia aquimaris TaxID=744461 RepID=A0ABW3FL93_9HYPH
MTIEDNKPLSREKLVTIFGGSGFVGRYAVREFAKRGWRVRVACRRPDLAGHLQPLGNVGQIQLVQANLRFKDSIDSAVEGADVVVNLVAILAESGKQTFQSLQARGAQWVAQAAKAEGAKMVQISAIGADDNSRADYARTKAAGERLVHEVLPDAIILRPSIIFGPEDDFFNRFAGMATMAPALPLIGGGSTMFQPVYVVDVAKAIVKAAEGELEPGSIWELGGPEKLTFRECLEQMLEVIERKRLLVSLPFPIASAMGAFAQYLPGAPITPGQVEMLKSDNVVSTEMEAAGRTLEGMGVTPTALSAILPTYLVRFRKHGQFEARRGL